MLVALPACAVAAGDDVNYLANLSIEQLSQVKVLSVSRYPESRFTAAAPVFVITRDDIRRSGVTSLPEALRLAPGVEVARVGSHQWSIAIHGFNSNLSNKLLVLIDGRSVYSPLYAGVFWDVQDVLLEDVDRIEVITGPGGTLWGANAVNGVINIITRSAQETQGGFAQIGGGNEETGFAGLRYGGQLGKNVAARAYLKFFNRDESRLATGGEAVDDWHMRQGGFRLDTAGHGADRYTVRGDAYTGREAAPIRGNFTLGRLPGPSLAGNIDVGGANLLGGWKHYLDDGAYFRVRTYWDHTRRDIPNTYNERRDTYDLDAKHFLAPHGRHQVIWGAAYRLTQDQLDDTLFASFIPSSRSDQTFSVFLQDKINLWQKRLFLTLGTKFEHNDYSGFETQPNARLAWLISHRQSAWAAVSRAVRIPSRLESDLHLTAPLSIPSIPQPVFVQVSGSPDFEEEKLLAYETGYRLQARDNLSFDLSAFYNHYDDLMTTTPGTPVSVAGPPSYLLIPAAVKNDLQGKAYGGTLTSDWRPLDPWRLQFQYSYFQMQLEAKPGSPTTNDAAVSGNSPRHQAAVYSFLDLSRTVSLYSGLRFVDKLPNLKVPRYAALDMSLLWRATPHLELALTAQNLGDQSHPEYSGGSEIERSLYASVTWRD